MSEIEKILEQNMEEYESARRRAHKLVNATAVRSVEPVSMQRRLRSCR